MTETHKRERRVVPDPDLSDYARLHLILHRLERSMERYRVPEKHPERYAVEYDRRLHIRVSRWVATVPTILA